MKKTYTNYMKCYKCYGIIDTFQQSKAFVTSTGNLAQHQYDIVLRELAAQNPEQTLQGVAVWRIR